MRSCSSRFRNYPQKSDNAWGHLSYVYVSPRYSGFPFTFRLSANGRPHCANDFDDDVFESHDSSGWRHVPCQPRGTVSGGLRGVVNVCRFRGSVRYAYSVSVIPKANVYEPRDIKGKKFEIGSEAMIILT
jgi:hypothetical protein